VLETVLHRSLLVWFCLAVIVCLMLPNLLREVNITECVLLCRLYFQCELNWSFTS